MGLGHREVGSRGGGGGGGQKRHETNTANEGSRERVTRLPCEVGMRVRWELECCPVGLDRHFHRWTISAYVDYVCV